MPETPEIKTKWKAFAAEYSLTDWGPGLRADQVFDLITGSSAEDLGSVFDKNKVVVWYPFETMPLVDFAWGLKLLAADAQWVEERE